MNKKLLIISVVGAVALIALPQETYAREDPPLPGLNVLLPAGTHTFASRRGRSFNDIRREVEENKYRLKALYREYKNKATDLIIDYDKKFKEIDMAFNALKKPKKDDVKRVSDKGHKFDYVREYNAVKLDLDKDRKRYERLRTELLLHHPKGSTLTKKEVVSYINDYNSFTLTYQSFAYLNHDLTVLGAYSK